MRCCCGAVVLRNRLGVLLGGPAVPGAAAAAGAAGSEALRLPRLDALCACWRLVVCKAEASKWLAADRTETALQAAQGQTLSTLPSR